MKISKEAWQEMNCMNQEKADPPQVTPLPDIELGDEIYYPKVDHPKHYNVGKYETIDVIEDWKLDFHCGNAVKYISRHLYKEHPQRDIEKAIWYLQRYLNKLKDENN
tara:strand:+ start:1654 stop:1974 length:321 start_codon:yes stop_codon:yes gene_type:complete